MSLSTKVPQDVKAEKLPVFEAGLREIYLLGLGLVLGGCVISWNKELEHGFFTFLSGWIIITTLYLCLVLCLAEMTSVVAFAGGSYGFVRCSISPFMGYLSGCSELLQNNFYVICSVASIGATITHAFETPVELEPLWFLLTYFAVICWHLRGGRYFWFTMSICGFVTFVIILLYCLMVITQQPAFFHYDFTAHKHDQAEGKRFMHVLTAPMWMFIGNETLTIAGAKISNGREVIPKAMLWLFATVTTLTLVTIFCVYLEYPIDQFKLLYETDYPLSYGFGDFIPVSTRLISLLTIIPNYSTALGFMYASKHLTQALALSGLFPPFFKQTAGENKIPIRALLTCFVTQYVILLLVWAATTDHSIPLFEVVVSAASFNFLGLFLAFLAFRKKFPNLDRAFTSPLNEYGAYLGMTLCMVLIIAIHGFQDSLAMLAIYYVYILAMIVYYFYVAEKRQFFSPEEQKKFMKAYILNANKRKKFLSKNANMNKGLLAKGFNKLKEALGIADDGCLSFLDRFIYSSSFSAATSNKTNASNLASPVATISPATTESPSKMKKSLPAISGFNKVMAIETALEEMSNNNQIDTPRTVSEETDSETRPATPTNNNNSSNNMSRSSPKNQNLFFKALHNNRVMPSMTNDCSRETATETTDNSASDILAVATTTTDSVLENSTLEERFPALELAGAGTITWTGQLMDTRASRTFFEILSNESNNNHDDCVAEDSVESNQAKQILQRVSREFPAEIFTVTFAENTAADLC